MAPDPRLKPVLNAAASTPDPKITGERSKPSASPKPPLHESSTEAVEPETTLTTAQTLSERQQDTAMSSSSPKIRASPQDDEAAAIPNVPVAKRGRGRPRKVKPEDSGVAEPGTAKRGVGRPRKDGLPPRSNKAEAAALSLLQGIRDAETPSKDQPATNTTGTAQAGTTSEAPQAESEPTVDEATDLDSDTAMSHAREEAGWSYQHRGDERVVAAVETYVKRPGDWFFNVNKDMTLSQYIKVYEVACQIDLLNLKDTIIDTVGEWKETFGHGGDRAKFCRETLDALVLALESPHVLPKDYEFEFSGSDNTPTDRLQYLLTGIVKENINELRHKHKFSRILDTSPHGRELQKISERKSRVIATPLIQCPACNDTYPRGSLSRCIACQAAPGAWLSTSIGSYVDSRERSEIARDIGNIRYILRCPEQSCGTLMPRETFYPTAPQTFDSHPGLWKGACVACGTHRQEWASCLVAGKFVDLRNDDAFAKGEQERVLRMAQGRAPMRTNGQPY